VSGDKSGGSGVCYTNDGNGKVDVDRDVYGDGGDSGDDSRQQTSDNRQQTVDNIQQTIDSRHQTADDRQ
jgi:hypothetical protein